MKRGLELIMGMLLAFGFLLGVGVAFAGEIVRDYPPEEIAPGVWVIHGPLGVPSVENQGFMNNPGFVETADGVVVIDPGSSLQAGRMVVKAVKFLTAKPVTHVFNTHVHGDHWLGNQGVREAFPDAVIYGHRRMIDQAAAGAGETWVDLMATLSGGFTSGTEAVIPDRAVGSGAVMGIGGVTFRILAPDKAHSDTDIMIHVVEKSVLFLGDNVTHGRIGQLNAATFKGNRAACDIAAGVGAAHNVPGHGKTGPVGIIRLYRDYLATLYEAVAAFYNEGLEDYEMKRKVVERLKVYQNWVGFDGEVGRHISLALLEVEEASF